MEEVKPLLEQGELSLSSLSVIAPILTQENAKTILPEVVGKPVREVEKVVHKHFPERAVKKEKFEAELDDELKALLEEARKIAGEKNSVLLLKKVLKDYTRERKTRTLSSAHTRRVPKTIARETIQKAGHQCEYRSKTSVRCTQTARLEVDHVRPYAMGGSSKDPKNLRCLCKVHNLYFARLYFEKARRFVCWA